MLYISFNKSEKVHIQREIIIFMRVIKNLEITEYWGKPNQKYIKHTMA